MELCDWLVVQNQTSYKLTTHTTKDINIMIGTVTLMDCYV